MYWVPIQLNPRTRTLSIFFALKFCVLIDLKKKTANTISGLGYRTLEEFELLSTNFWSI